MQRLLVLIATLVLTACGGGGGGGPDLASNTSSASSTSSTNTSVAPQPFSCVTPQLRPNRYRAATFDVRRDDPGKTEQGHNITSLAAVKLMIDRAKCVGFDTAIFETNIPIDISTGLLRADQPIPVDFWQYVSYAKSIGLRVAVRPLPVNYVDDNNLTGDTPGLSVSQALVTVKNFEKNLAIQAQIAGVDIFYVGLLNYGIDNVAYNTEWQAIVDAVKAVYTGKLAYTTCFLCTNTVVWAKVDIIGIETSVGNAAIGATVVPHIHAIAQNYNKPIVIDNVYIYATPPSYASNSLWNSVNSGSVGSFLPDYVEQARKFNEFFTYMILLKSDIQGFAIGAYMPWIQSSGIQKPITNIETQFKLWDTLGFSLYNNIQAQTTIQSYLNNPGN
jgi:hypothetical protein